METCNDDLGLVSAPDPAHVCNRGCAWVCTLVDLSELTDLKVPANLVYDIQVRPFVSILQS